MLEIEFLNNNLDATWLMGVDEVGRGPLAGPVFACSVAIFGKRQDIEDVLNQLKGLGVTDSKKLSEKKRLKIIELLDIQSNEKFQNDSFFIEKDFKNCRIGMSCFSVSEEIIDNINILQAALKAMSMGIEQLLNGFLLECGKGIILIDGNQMPQLKNDSNKFEVETVVKGDAKCITIGLASIIAKHVRDRMMARASETYPAYGFEKNAGYPTAIHLEAIKLNGPCPIHRKTFKGVKEHFHEKVRSDFAG